MYKLSFTPPLIVLFGYFVTHSTSMASCCKEKRDVIVRVYVERPTRRRVSLHHYHHHNLHVQQANRHSANGAGYNRKQELLNYTRQLRASSQSQSQRPLPLVQKPFSRVNKQPTTHQNMALRNERKHDKNVSCFGNWKFLNPSCWANPKNKKEKRKKKNSTTISIKSAVQIIQDRTKGNFFKKLSKTLKKYR